MKNLSYLLLCTVLLISCSSNKQKPADAVYSNGKIYTVNPEQAWAEAIAVSGKHIVFVGTNDDVQAYIGKNTKVIDLNGKMVMPGVVDAHIHPYDVYLQEYAGNLMISDQLGADEIKSEILKYANANPDKEWIKGMKYGFGAFPGGKMTKEWLDDIIFDRPVYIWDESGHNATANSKALEIAGITKDTPNPPLGIIDKDPLTGEPTGYLSETGMSLVGRHIPRVEYSAYKKSIETSLKEMKAWGITSFIDMLVNEPILDAYFEINDEGNFPFRASVALAMNEYTDEVITAKQAKEYLPKAIRRSNSNIETNHFKYWADGTPLSYTSLLVDKYADKDTYGAITMTDEMREDAISFLGQGVSGHMHAITDGTVRFILDLVEEAHERYPGKVKRFHIGHNFLVKAEDYPRYNKFDIVAEVGPAMWYPSPVKSLLEEKLGVERASTLFDFRGMIDAGVNVAWGSDWPAGTPDANPFRGLEAMVTRMHPWGEYEGSWGTPISLEEGLKIITMGGAYAMHKEDSIGSLEVGKYADFIILSENLFDIEPSGISEILVMNTYFEGNQVFNRSEAYAQLDVIDFEILNKNLDNAIDEANLNLLLQEEKDIITACCSHHHEGHDHATEPGSKLAPLEVNEAFAKLTGSGHEFLRPARAIYWKATNTYYWIQWTIKDDKKMLWAFDPQMKDVVEVLSVNDK